MKTVLSVLLFASVFFVLSCGTSVSSLDDIQNRLNRNQCRINRENLIFEIQGLEYSRDTLFTHIPTDLLADSLLVCPADSSQYIMVVDGNSRKILCSHCQADSDF